MSATKQQKGYALWIQTRRYPEWSELERGPDAGALWAEALRLDADDWPAGTTLCLTSAGGHPSDREARVAWISYARRDDDARRPCGH